MHLLLFLALLVPHTQLPQVQVDPNYNCMMRGTCITTGQPTQTVITVPHTPTVRQQQQYHERAVKAQVHAWRMFIDECQHRRLRNLYRKPSFCKVVK